MITFRGPSTARWADAGSEITGVDARIAPTIMMTLSRSKSAPLTVARFMRLVRLPYGNNCGLVLEPPGTLGLSCCSTQQRSPGPAQLKQKPWTGLSVRP